MQNEVSVGGQVKYIFEDEHFTIDGNYEEVSPQKLLVYTWNWHFNAGTMEDTAFKLTVRFDGDEDHSALSISQTGFGSQEHIHPHTQGWNNWRSLYIGASRETTLIYSSSGRRQPAIMKRPNKRKWAVA